MNSRKPALAGAAAIAAATAVTALIIGSTSAAAEDSRPSSAFGISASGLLNISPLPEVVSKDGKPVYNELLGLSKVPVVNGLGITAGVLTVQAKHGAAESSVVKVDIPKLLHADLVRTSCRGGHGKLQIVKGSVLGHDLPSDPIANQTIDVSPLLKVTLGEETHNGDGSVTVTGIELTVLPGKVDLDAPLSAVDLAAVPALGELLGKKLTAVDTVRGLADQLGGGLQTITIGSATCGHGGDSSDGGDSDDDATPVHSPDKGDAPAAPAPKVVDGDLPVTH